jgi:hypothetical protein
VSPGAHRAGGRPARRLGGRPLAAAARVLPAPRRREVAAARGLGAGGGWQKKLTLNGRVVRARIAASSRRIDSGDSIVQGSEPRAPALLTATALPCTPAIGARMIGSSVPRSEDNLFMAKPSTDRRSSWGGRPRRQPLPDRHAPMHAGYRAVA